MPAEPPVIPSCGMAYLREVCSSRGLPSPLSKAMLASVNSSTLKSYRRLWTDFASWIDNKQSRPHLTPPLVCEFLYFKFCDGSSTSSMNSFRSAINFFTLNSLDLENNIFMKRLFKYFYQARPLRPRYSTFWPVSKLLNFLKSWHPMESLSLKNLSLRTIALLALTSSDRGQTLHLASLDNMVIEENSLKFVVKDRVKTTRKVLRPTVIDCVSSNIEELDVSSYVKYYLDSTKDIRIVNNRKLFISWKTKKNVTKSTLARWLTIVLKAAGIDTSTFTAHSYRGAGLSSAFQRGASINQIMNAGNWKNADIFHNYYCAPSEDTAIGNIILNDF